MMELTLNSFISTLKLYFLPALQSSLKIFLSTVQDNVGVLRNGMRE